MERDDAIKLANRVLEDHRLDPDGDLPVLARQFLRHVETVRSLVYAAGGHILVSDADVRAGNDSRFALVYDRTTNGCDIYLEAKD